MPQLDIFIFINTGIYLLIGFFGILVFNHLYILPSLGSLIKIRRKLVSNKVGASQTGSVANTELKSISFDKFLQK